MRKLRTSALAIATATTVALGGMTVAGAQPNGSSSTSATTTEGDSVELVETEGPTLSSAIGGSLEAGKPADPTAIFGSDKAGFGEQPAWAQAMYITGVIAAAGAFFGLVVAPIANFIKFNYFA